jgi:head-tail adaptor
MNIGQLRQRVALANSPTTTDDADGYWEPLTPEFVAAAIQPLAPGGDEHTVTHQVTIRYHSQVASGHTRVQFTDPRKGYIRELRVTGVQDVDERHEEMRLLCEEVTP